MTGILVTSDAPERTVLELRPWVCGMPPRVFPAFMAPFQTARTKRVAAGLASAIDLSTGHSECLVSGELPMSGRGASRPRLASHSAPGKLRMNTMLVGEDQ